MNKSIFISYSWGDEAHFEQVLSFVNFLRENGFEATFDRLEMQKETSIEFKQMMLKGLSESEKVIIVLSEEYKNKADNFKGGVGDEYKYIIEEINENKTKYILVSFDGVSDEVINKITPKNFKGREIIDLSKYNDQEFQKLFSKIMDENLIEISEVSVNKPSIKKKNIENFFNLLDINKNGIKKEENEVDIDKFLDSCSFFNYRMGQAFPGLRGGKWFDNIEEILGSLKILLKKPLNKKKAGMMAPIWWLRGNSCMDIDNFEVINNEKCIIEIKECKIDKIYVYRTTSLYHSFVYVELKPDEPTGIYEDYEENINFQMDYTSYATEEFAMYNDKIVTMAEFDDDATCINGEIIPLNGKARVRLRHLTKYNFLICAEGNPINSDEGDKISKKYLDHCLDNKYNMEDFIRKVHDLPRRKMINTY